MPPPKCRLAETMISSPSSSAERDGEDQLAQHLFPRGGVEPEVLHPEQQRGGEQRDPAPGHRAAGAQARRQALHLGHQQAAVVDLLGEGQHGLAADDPEQQTVESGPAQLQSAAQQPGQAGPAAGRSPRRRAAWPGPPAASGRAGPGARSCAAPARRASRPAQQTSSSPTPAKARNWASSSRLGAVPGRDPVEQRVVQRQRDPLLDQQHQQDRGDAAQPDSRARHGAAAPLARGHEQQEEDAANSRLPTTGGT